jgi:hypothetical protein
VQTTGRPKTIHHYTSQEGLLGIIQEGILRVSSIRHLNDAAEMTHAIELVKSRLNLSAWNSVAWEQFIERLPKHLELVKESDCHVGSFSQERDQLSQWRAYTRGGVGYSIGFNVGMLEDFADDQKFELVRCVYTAEEHNELSNGVVTKIEKFLPDNVDTALALCAHHVLRIAPRVKHPSFAEEKEWRITKEVGLEESVKFRSGKSMLVPYGEFIFKDEHDNTPITEIVVGPTPHMELSKRSVERLLLAHDMAHVPVIDSLVPFRNW